MYIVYKSILHLVNSTWGKTSKCKDSSKSYSHSNETTPTMRESV